MPSFAELRAFAEMHAPTRTWIESVKDEVVGELQPTGVHVLLLRSMLEDLLVCGAACQCDGKLVDVGTIQLLLDTDGCTPLSPNPAYEQTIWGTSKLLLTAERVQYIRLRGEGVYPQSSVEKLMQLKSEIRRIFYDVIAKDAQAETVDAGGE